MDRKMQLKYSYTVWEIGISEEYLKDKIWFSVLALGKLGPK